MPSSREILPSPSSSPPEKAAACLSSTATESKSSEIDWQHAFKLLAAAYGREMISGDVHYFVARGLKPHVDVEVLKTFCIHVGLNRGKNINDFMG